ncbi:MAG TPA: 1-deoxy-D-xylulose-5-phosphate reductoisomerase, partial [Gemmatimonadales bacterium]
MVGVALLGSTGSIGRSTLAVLRRQRTHFRLVAVTAGCNRAELEAQAAEWSPDFVGLAERQADAAYPTGPDVLVEAVLHPGVEVVVNAVVGVAG